MHALTSPPAPAAPRVWLVTPSVSRSNRCVAPAGLPLTWIIHHVGALVLSTLTAVVMFAAVFLSRDVQFFITDGDGLEPSIPSGSLIVVEPVGDRALAVGEIITMPNAAGSAVSGYVTEVINGPGGLRYTAHALGDDAGESRALFADTELGRVALFVPGVAKVLNALMSNVGRALAGALALLVALARLVPIASRRTRARRRAASPRPAPASARSS